MQLCINSRTRKMLSSAPAQYRHHAGMTMRDFDRSAHQPLVNLRSDNVADEFRVHFSVGDSSAMNLFVARMTVPGGPWPGHYGLEGILFSARQVFFPTWFPSAAWRSQLVFGNVANASHGFLRGQGAVLFPELLALEQPLEYQGFGVVFVDKLVSLFTDRVVPALELLGIEGSDYLDIQSHRELAFLAHEWGHLSGPVAYDETVQTRRRRVLAVVSELHADLAGFTMLMTRGSVESIAAAKVLVLDRICREAWLPRAHSQVDSIAARQMLIMLRDNGLSVIAGGDLRLDWQNVARRLAGELRVVEYVDQACLGGEVEPARAYLASYGWKIGPNGFHISLVDNVAAAFRAAANTKNATRPSSSGGVARWDDRR